MLFPFYGYNGLLSHADDSAPHVHARESENALLIELDVPRYRLEEINVTRNATEGKLTIVGKREEDHHHASFSELLFGHSQPTQFRRVVRLSAKHYDIEKTTSTLGHGVLTLTVPKVTTPAPESVPLLESSKPGVVATTTTHEQFAQVAKAKWPPVIKREATETAVTFRCELPAGVKKEAVDLTLKGTRLVLSVHSDFEMKSEEVSESQSVTYSTVINVPAGTTASDIHTEFDDSNALVIHMAKHEKPAAVPVKEPAAE